MRNTRRLTWHSSFCWEGLTEGSPQENWALWQKYLDQRPPSISWEPGKSHPLMYAVSQGWYQSEEIACRHARVTKLTPRAKLAQQLAGSAAQWLETPEPDQQFHDFLALGWAYVLPTATRFLEADLWWALTEELFTLAESSVETALNAEEPLSQQWLAAELPFILSLQLPELGLSEVLADQAFDVLHQGFDQWTDGEGLPAAAYYPSLRMLLACWTRCRQLLRWHPVLDWTTEAETQLAWLLRRAAELTRSDGSAMLAREPSVLEADLFYDALNETDLLEVVIPSAMLWDNTQSALVPETLEPNQEEPANYSEWSELGWLRATWRHEDPAWLALHHRPQLLVELNAYGITWLSGAWTAEVQVEGNRLELDPWYDWEHQLWLNDEDVSYLELQRGLSDELVLQRQMLLARKDRFLLLMECVLGKTAQPLQLRSTLPLAPQVELISMERANERLLVHGRRVLRVVPLSLSEWQSERRVGHLSYSDEGLQLTQHSMGPGLCAAWWIDLDTRRANRFVTWRHLTVAQERSALVPGQAVGYRLQVGKKNWVFYRSLIDPANRTFLGINLTTQFLAARFLRKGTTETLLEVE